MSAQGQNWKESFFIFLDGLRGLGQADFQCFSVGVVQIEVLHAQAGDYLQEGRLGIAVDVYQGIQTDECGKMSEA